MESNLPERELFHNLTTADWYSTLRLLARTLPSSEPSVVVLDEVPYLMATPSFEAELQAIWDQELLKKPVLLLLLLIDSDMSMMEALSAYERPFHQRGTPMVLNPLNPAEVGAMLDLTPAQAYDAYLITGGLPLNCTQWPRGSNQQQALAEMLTSPTTAIWVGAELSLAAEFPPDAHARTILTAIGSGERSYSLIGRASGDLPAMTLKRALDLLVAKRLVAVDQPFSTRPANQKRYRIEDPYLRFWLSFLGPYRDEIDRGRPDITLRRINTRWESWRGRAIEPIIREALFRLLPNEKTHWLDLDDTRVVGGYWTRSNDVEVDLIGVDRAPIAKRIGFVGPLNGVRKADLIAAIWQS